jgi:type I restriction enzyme M protein
MLDNETRRRIDTARDILVGKLPDPKSQVEQITIALIYKFMDDMDKEAVDFGGEPTFFTGEYEKYSWTNIFNPKIGGYEMLNLYGEAIMKLNQNPNIPQLFRDIFKNAYLPYRDPETLKLFLKTINEFQYDHSEKLGDAFEYLLSVLGSQGDAGQFRTPRHIIDFIVAVMQPKKNETICDPACGTAGFLISAYKYILKQNSGNSANGVNSSPFSGGREALTPDDRKKMMKNFVGYDISPDMVRLSLVNMYLHNFTSPRVYEYDTLTSEDRWGDYFDMILANPPFMSPKGGIKPHKKFSLQANRSEVLFVDYIAEHINPTAGRAGIIVPEGIIFQSANAYKQLRQMLVDKKYLYAVVSLPAGIFQPYSGVKTSILLMDRTLAKKSDNILFVKIDNDGFDLGAQRRAIDKNDLTAALVHLQEYKDSLLNNTAFVSDNKNVFVVDKSVIKGTGDYNLTIDRYREREVLNQTKYPLVKMQDVCEINPKKSEVKSLPENTIVSFVPMADINEDKSDFIPKEERKLSEVFGGYTYFKDDDVLIAKVTPCFENGKAGVAKNLKNGIGFGSSEFHVIRCSEKVLPSFIYLIATTERFKKEGKNQMTGTGGLQRVPKDFIANFHFPLPPIPVQRQLFNNVAYQKIIDGAKQVVENYKPQIDIDPDWEMVELGEVLEKINDNVDPQLLHGKVNYVGLENITSETGGLVGQVASLGTDIKSTKTKFKKEDILYGKLRPNLNKVWLADFNGIASTDIFVLRVKEGIAISKFYAEYLRTKDFNTEVLKGLKGAQLPRVGFEYFSTLLVPLPSFGVQQLIVSGIEQEQNLVNSNKELIKIYEQKIKDEINKLWQPGKKEVVYEMEEVVSMVAEE